ncbi:segregation/condensation protein A [Aciduricibacillus chroicocephali]|uniref:Segregation and condensation protein A n=1 Tax=Aciduricibacillus chroicocephali TaxID=3054939 RepID=A0ABY9KS04_9BACI|nr:segregation/condensation protein A [Bacillaceae bacterium 44XB]
MNEGYEVKLDIFEGPLDLLLHLINKLEIDIYDIPVAVITEQYVEYIRQLQELELNIAGEYLVMAATLLALKSKMLLPRQEVPEPDEEYEEDPREELMDRLITYQTFKEAARKLQEKEEKSVFTRAPSVPPEENNEAEHTAPAPTESTVYDLISALGNMLERKEWEKPSFATVTRSEIPVEERMREIVLLLENAPQGLRFETLFQYPSKAHIVATFLALLELLKNGRINCHQERQFSDMHIGLIKSR